ncbi:MAG TPA: response regulator transcription factor [Methylomirabilota bacterium]|jgi:DNA-binding NarL/FixJ family response regulator
MIRPTILLADDHTIVLEGLAGLLRTEFSLVGTVPDGNRLLAEAQRLRPDVIVTDMTMPGLSGIEVLRRLKHEAIQAKVIVLTMHADAATAAQALRAGAVGFVVKHAASTELIAAIRTVLRGGRYLPPHLADDILATLAEGEAAGGGGPLTPRQREVVSLIATGKTMKQIAVALGMSPRTVETHKYQAMETLGFQTTAELIRYAIAHGLGGTADPDARS